MQLLQNSLGFFHKPYITPPSASLFSKIYILYTANHLTMQIGQFALLVGKFLSQESKISANSFFQNASVTANR